MDFVSCIAPSIPENGNARAVPGRSTAANHGPSLGGGAEAEPRPQQRSASHAAGASAWCALRAEKVKPAGKPGSVTGIAPYDGHSSRRRVAPALQPPTRGLERATHSTPRPARAASAYLVLLRVEVTAFHPLGAERADKSARRSQGLVSVALFLVFAKGKPSTSPYGR